jgi:hypothetical protein
VKKTMRVRFLFLALLLTVGACGGNPTTPPVPPPTTSPARAATLADLSATFSSPVAGSAIGCREEVRGRVALTNAAPSSVSVISLRKITTVVSGVCQPSDDTEYRLNTGLAAAQSTTVIFDQPLYRVGAGCCPDPNRCSGATCEFNEEFTVLTSVGAVPAGSFNYRVTFQNCQGCADATANNCAPGRLREP